MGKQGIFLAKEDVMDTIEMIMDAYAEDLAVAACSYGMIDGMLDTSHVKERVGLLRAREIYVYGAGCLGAYLYRAIKNMVTVLAMVDKDPCVPKNRFDIPVIGPGRFRDLYGGQMVIIASVKHFKEIRDGLSQFVPQGRLMYIGEFLGGGLE